MAIANSTKHSLSARIVESSIAIPVGMPFILVERGNIINFGHFMTFMENVWTMAKQNFHRNGLQKLFRMMSWDGNYG